LSANAVQAAPRGLASTIAFASFKGTATTASTVTVVQETLRLMARTKAKTAFVVATGILLAVGTSNILTKEFQPKKVYAWQVEPLRSEIVSLVEPQVRIVPSKFAHFGGWVYGDHSLNKKVVGIGATVAEILQAAYGTAPARILFPDKLPQQRYDFIANLPAGSEDALQMEVKKQFGLLAKREMREANVLFLKSKEPLGHGLKPTAGRGSRDDTSISAGHCYIPNQPLARLAEMLEGYFEVPVIDQTGIVSSFDIDLSWHEENYRQHPDALKQALLTELGIELVPGREKIAMIVVEKVKEQ
jgi:uncharacterized protein (TIGR03435 family)